MATDTKGRVHVVWEDDSQGNYEILYRRWDALGWSAIENLSQNEGMSSSAALAADSRGNLHVAWQDYSPGNYEVFYRRWNGSLWLSAENVSLTGGTSAMPAVAADAEGDVHIVWREYTTGESSILYRRWSRLTSGWSAAENVVPRSTTAESPGVAVDSVGNTYVVWIDEHQSNSDVFYRRWNGAAWLPVENLSLDLGRSVSPAIAAGLGRDVHVAWQDATSGNWEILYRRLSEEWSPAENLSENTGLSGSPSLAVDAAGSVHVAWMDDTPGNYEIFHRVWTAGAWSATENVSANGGFSWSPAVAVDTSGAAHFAWEDNTPGNFDILYAGPALSPVVAPTPTLTPTPTPTLTPVATPTPTSSSTPTATLTPSPNQIRLHEGWNLISVPAPLQNPSVGVVLAQAPAVTRVFTCVGESWTSASRGVDGWGGTLTQIVEGQGYFVYATAPITLTLSLKAADPLAGRSSYPLPVGWSLIGYSTPLLSPSSAVAAYLKSIEGKWASLYRLDAARGWEIAKPGGVGFPEMERGKGYWISLRSPGTLTP
ncbi:MAG: hypothetical protein HYX92_01215 [Chloroflexi bacterium]|nr:hypothetical protein [Chloroflexota bacterium]